MSSPLGYGKLKKKKSPLVMNAPHGSVVEGPLTVEGIIIIFC